MVNLLLTLLAGGIVGYAFYKMKVPGGLMIGAVIGVAAINILFGAAYMPSETKTVTLIIAGAFIGGTVEKSDLKRLPYIAKPTIVMLVTFLVLNLVTGTIIYWIGPLDLVTSLMSAVPGGISDTPIIAAVMGADAPKVAVMQIVRQVLGIGIFPSMIMAYHSRKKTVESDDRREAFTGKREKSKTKSWAAFAATMVVAIIFGVAGKYSGLPAGAFVFSIISVLILKLTFDFAYLPRWAKQGAQVLSGAYIGSSIMMADILDMRYLLLPILVIVIGYAANCFITGKIISKMHGITEKEAMLITTPAGASDMALISSDMGVQNTDIVVMQIIRAVVVMTFFPQIISLICTFFK
ncbi:AbrB family transcriptional regulator [Anaeroselena agilis]|uniref:AbrB family transcriptional regulator n=1 Tax=Anaeroselena agilis TaxID=3063788 RepID=A0ABU3NU47_9FIRM|nr:AbrB family transcriptional regulator [Selenomonadales bacterium 4137-cl]